VSGQCQLELFVVEDEHHWKLIVEIFLEYIQLFDQLDHDVNTVDQLEVRHLLLEYFLIEINRTDV